MESIWLFAFNGTAPILLAVMFTFPVLYEFSLSPFTPVIVSFTDVVLPSLSVNVIVVPLLLNEYVVSVSL